MIDGMAERLRNLRWQNNYSQKEVADILGLSPSIISGYETGERTPSTDVIVKLTGLYRCSADYLLGISKDPESALDVSGLSPTEVHALHVLVESIRKSTSHNFL